MRIRRQISVSTLLLLAAGFWTTNLCGQSWKGAAVYTFPDVHLSDFLQAQLGITVDDHGINLGGIGSDLWHHPEDGPGVYWMVTDRGPNGQIRVGTQNRRTFPVPEFTPFILNPQS